MLILSTQKVKPNLECVAQIHSPNGENFIVKSAKNSHIYPVVPGMGARGL